VDITVNVECIVNAACTDDAGWRDDDIVIHD
jgi:hypothetical protein